MHFLECICHKDAFWKGQPTTDILIYIISYFLTYKKKKNTSQQENARNKQCLTFFWYHTTASFTLEAIYISLLPA